MESTNHRAETLEELRAAAQAMSRPSMVMRALIAEKAGLNATDAECIDYLLSNVQCTASDLAAMTGLSKSTITYVLKRIEKAGYITRQVSAADRRIVYIHPNLPLIQAHFGLYYTAVTVGFQNIVDTYTTEELMFLIKHYNSMTRLYEQQIALLSGVDA